MPQCKSEQKTWIKPLLWNIQCHVWMWELDNKKGWVRKNWCLWTVVLKKTLENPLDCKEIKPVNPTGNQPWIFIGRTDAEAQILWPPDIKSQLIGKDPDAGKDWRQEEKGITEDEMVGWCHRLNGQEFEQTPGNGEGSLVCCSPWGRKESDMTEQLNNNCEMLQTLKYFWLYFFFCLIMVFNKGCSFSAVSLFYIFSRSFT